MNTRKSHVHQKLGRTQIRVPKSPDSIGSLRALNQALDFNQDLVEGARRFLRFGSTPRLDQAAGTKLNHQSHKNNGAPRRGFYTTQGLPRS
jgi:hypothetical protein